MGACPSVGADTARAGVRSRSAWCCLPTIAALASTLAGCAHALGELVPFEQVVGGIRARSSEEVDGLLARAEASFRRWDDAGVEEASTLWAQAAASDRHRVEGLEGIVRARIWVTEHRQEARAREEAAAQAVRAAQWCLEIAPQEAACSYWLGAALGVRARENPSTGLSALPTIEQSFMAAAAADPALEEAGPDRALALLYLRAPGWPAGPGDPQKGLEHARKAVALGPAYPPNHLALGEALAATGDAEAARESYARARDFAKERAAHQGAEAAEWLREAERALEGK